MFENYSDRVDELKLGDLIIIEPQTQFATNIILNKPVIFLYLEQKVALRTEMLRDEVLFTSEGHVRLFKTDTITLLAHFSGAVNV